MLCVLLVFSVALFAQDTSVDELVSKGVANYNEGNLKTSYEIFKQAMKINPNHPEASRWFWKMKKEHDVKNLTDKGAAITEITKNESKEAVATPKSESAAEKKVEQARTEVKTVIFDPGRSALLDKKMARIDEKLSRLVEEVKTSRAMPAHERAAISLSALLTPMTIGIISVLGIIVFLFLMMLLMYRARQKRIPAPPVYVESADAVAKKVMERLGIEESDEKKVLALESAKKLLAQNPARAGQMMNVLTRLSLDENETISQKSRFLIELLKEQSGAFEERNSAHVESLPGSVETYTEGFLLLLQSKYQWDHSKKVRLLAREMGLRMSLTKAQIKELEIASLMQNVGFIRIPDIILNKKTQLSKDEMAQIHMHPEYSAEVAKVMQLPESIVEGVRSHHERYNGNGYPARLHGSAIPLYARIIGICDSFAALTSRKPFKNPVDAENALAILKKESYLFDPEIVSIFSDVIGLIHFSDLAREDALVVQQ